MPLRMAIPAAELSAVSSSKSQKSFAKETKNSSAIVQKPTKKTSSKKKNNPQNEDNSAFLRGMIIFLVGTLTSALITRFVALPNFQQKTKIITPMSNSTVQSISNAAINSTINTTIDLTTIARPTYAMYTHRKNQDNLQVIRKILKLLGYTEVGLDDNWNVLWGFETPFPDLREKIKKIQTHQIVNHMPGMYHIAHKVQLSTSGSPYMPPAFKLPEEKAKFLIYAEQNPDKLFVEKSNGHRHVSIKKPKDINLESNTTFVQEFLTNPYLVDGYKFDIGVYTVITSIDPLRIYIYTGDVMFRYCQEKFHPFDPNVLAKYVVGDAYRPTWQVPTLKKYFTRFGGGMRASFDAYVREKGKDPSKIWQQAEEVIRYTIKSQAKNIAKTFDPYPTLNFFELIRVDMIIDTNFKVHLIEINLSPNMHSRKFKHNHIVFEQVLYNTMRLVGMGSPIKDQKDLSSIGQRIIAETADKSVASNLNECVQHDCNRECDEEEACSLCITCLDEEEFDALAKAHREHTHRGDMKRIFPKPILDAEDFDFEEETKNLTIASRMMTKWFYYKCLHDRSWCQ